jgi:Domain of unknown function (DUF4184)
LPFTLSHPAAIIPFARLRFVLSALVIGSLSPDFIYFVNLAPQGQFGHTLPGVFLFCLPVGLLVLLIFHSLLKWPIFSLMPLVLQERLIGPARSFTVLPIARTLLIVVSLLIGVFTHIIWDGFTHEYGWAVARLGFLSHPIIEIGSRTIPLFKLLQHSSTVIGGGLLLLCFIHWIRQAPCDEVRENSRRPLKSKVSWGIALFFGATILGLLSSWWKVAQQGNHGGLKLWLSCFVVGALSGLFVELVLFGCYSQLSQRPTTFEDDSREI